MNQTEPNSPPKAAAIKKPRRAKLKSKDKTMFQCTIQEKRFAKILVSMEKPITFVAAIQAGYAESVAKSDVYEWIRPENPRKPHLVRYIEYLTECSLAKVSIKGENVIRRLAILGFSNIADLVSVNARGEVKVKNLDDLPEEVQVCIESITKTKDGIRVKYCDKVKPLELVGKHLGVIKDKVEVNQNNHDEFVKKYSNLLPNGNGTDRTN